MVSDLELGILGAAPKLPQSVPLSWSTTVPIESWQRSALRRKGTAVERQYGKAKILMYTGSSQVCLLARSGYRQDAAKSDPFPDPLPGHVVCNCPSSSAKREKSVARRTTNAGASGSIVFGDPAAPRFPPLAQRRVILDGGRSRGCFRRGTRDGSNEEPDRSGTWNNGVSPWRERVGESMTGDMEART